MTRHTLLQVAAGIAVTIASARSLAAQTTAAFDKVDRIEDSWINRNPVPYRPMVAMGDGTIFAVNPYLSEVVHLKKDPVLFKFSIPASSSTWNGRFRTLPGPVSIARYQPPGDPLPHEQLLVVCQHVNALAIHDAVTGDLLGSVKVGAGPGDIVVDATNGRAWVSCALGDKVSAIDLATRIVLKSYDTSKYSRSPGFLCMYNGEVLVAPRISGNGSLVDRKDFPDGLAEEFDEHAGPRGILDTLKPEIADVGLPEHDLLWLDSSTLGNPSGGVTSIAKSTGTILLANAIRPTTSTLWQLDIDANNKNPALQSEAAVRGQIVFNRLTKIQLPAQLTGAAEVQPIESRYLDSTTAATSSDVIQYAPASSAIATPYSLAFNTNGSLCAVTGLMSDNVIFLNSTGNRFPNSSYELKEIPADTDNQPNAVDENTMPRQVLMSGNNLLAVWGGNLTAHFVDISNLSSPAHYWLRLGYDPTPAKVQEGRKLYFDGSHSLHANASCASCHDEGKSDMLAWNLSNIDAASHDGNDNKGPMVTQTLLNISRAMPFHWRGEQRRGLPDFNPAFDALLGGAPLQGVTLDPADGATITPDGEFDRFQAFVLSLTEDANQFENDTRVVDANIKIPLDPTFDPDPTGITIDATNGQAVFLQTCAACHMMPTATNNEVVDNVFGGEANPDVVWLKVAGFQGMQNKAKQTLFQVSFPPNTRKVSDEQVYPILGAGLSHAGVVRDSIPFMQVLLFDPTPTTSRLKDRLDTASFLYQFDTGIPPAAERMVFYNLGDLNALTQSLAYFLDTTTGQASAAVHNCDLAVIGKLKNNDPAAPFFGWVYEPVQDRFFGPNALGQNDAARQLSFFSTQVNDPDGGWFAFVGVPVGTAWRFAADFDGDQLPNQLEIQNGFDMFNPDTNGDGLWDGAQFYNGGEAAIHADATNNSPNVVGGTPDFQWATLTTARMTFETDEMTTAVLTLTPVPPLVPPIVLTDDKAGMHHNLLVTGLVYPLPLDLVARVPLGPRTPANLLMKVTSLHRASLFPQQQGTTGQIWNFDYEVTVGDRLNNPYPSVWVAARPLIDGKTAATAGVPFTVLASQPSLDFDVNTTEVNANVITVPYTPTGFKFNLHNDGDIYPTQDVTLPNVIPGPFAIGHDPAVSATFEPTSSAGRCDIQFTLDLTGKLVVGTKVTLCIEVMGAKQNPVNGRINMLGKGSFGIFTDQTDEHKGGGPFIPSFFCPPGTSEENRTLSLWWWSDSQWHDQPPPP